MINFVKFLHDICRQQEVQMNELQALFANIKQELSNFQDEQVGAPQAIPAGQNVGIYEKLCQLLDKPRFNTKDEIKKTIAQAKYHIALSKFEEKSYDESSILFLKAIEFDPSCSHFTNIYQCLADCYFRKPDTSHNGTKDIQDKTYKVIYQRFKNESQNIVSRLLYLLGPNRTPQQLDNLTHLEFLYKALGFLNGIKDLKMTEKKTQVLDAFVKLLNFLQKVEQDEMFPEKKDNNKKGKKNKTPQERAPNLEAFASFETQYGNLWKNFQDQVSGMVFYNASFLDAAFTQEIDSWFITQFAGTFTQLESLFIKNCLEIPQNNQNESDLERSINLLNHLPKKQKALQMISVAKYNLAQKNEDVMKKSQLLEESLSYDETNRETRRQLAEIKFNQEMYQYAIEHYKLIPDSGMVQMCYGKLQALKPDDYQIKIDFGKYLASDFKTEKAIDYFI